MSRGSDLNLEVETCNGAAGWMMSLNLKGWRLDQKGTRDSFKWALWRKKAWT
jgi:hypothetical protein